MQITFPAAPETKTLPITTGTHKFKSAEKNYSTDRNFARIFGLVSGNKQKQIALIPNPMLATSTKSKLNATIVRTRKILRKTGWTNA